MSQLSIAEDMYQQHVDGDDMGYRAARRDDYEERLDREYLGRNDHYGQPPKQSDVRLTMRGVPKPSNSDHYRQRATPRDPSRTMRSLYTLNIDAYLEKSSAAEVTKELSMIRQKRGESMHDYQKRYRQLVGSCRHHGISQDLLWEYFMNGMNPLERKRLEASGQCSISDSNEKATESSSHLGETRGPAPIPNFNDQIRLEEVQEVTKMATQVMTQNKELMELNLEQARTISELREQLSQLANDLSEMQDAKEKLPPQAIQPPKSNVNVVMIKDEERLDEDSLGLNEEMILENLAQNSMAISNVDDDKELWEFFSEVDALLGEDASSLIQHKMPIKCRDCGTLSIGAEGEVVNSRIHVSMQPPTNNVGDHALFTIDELKPLPDHPKQKHFEKRKRAPRKKKSSKAQEVQYKEKYYHKKNVGKAPTKIIFGQVYHLPVKVKHNAFWIAKSNNFKLTNVGIERELKLSQLKELRQRVNENHQDYKARAQKFYERFGRTKRSRKFDLERPWNPNL